MQKQTKKTVPEVNKPSLTGSWHGKDAYRLGVKMMLSVLFVSIIYLILSLLLSFDSLALRLIACAVLVGAATTYLYYNGMNAGQADAAYGEIMYQRMQDTKTITKADRDRCFHPAKGFLIALVGASPFLILALIFALMTKPASYSLGILPNWLTAYTRQSGIGDALAYYQTRDPISALSILRIVVRSMTMPFINVAVKMGDAPTLLAERLAPLWVMIAPLGYGFGYGQGLKLRAKINTGIMIGDQKKKRRERKERRARANGKTPERLV